MNQTINAVLAFTFLIMLVVTLILWWRYRERKQFEERLFGKKKPKKKVERRIAKKVVEAKEESELPTVKDGFVRERKKHEKLTLRDNYRSKRKPTSSFLVEILFSNGTSKEFIIATKEETFKYKGRTYYLRYENSRFNLTQREYKLYYHDDIAVPINLEVHKLPDKTQATREKQEAFFTVTPHNLKPLLKMEYIKALAQSQEISKYLKFTLVVVLINLAVAVITVYKMLGSAKGG